MAKKTSEELAVRQKNIDRLKAQQARLGFDDKVEVEINKEVYELLIFKQQIQNIKL